MKQRTVITAALVCVLSSLALAQDVNSFAQRITVKKLPNGLTVLICERPEAPVFSFFTLVDAGSAQDPIGQTGMAHMFEHMAFKGTDKIGTTDYAAEKPALAKVETAYAAYRKERDKEVGRDEAKLKQLEKDWKDAIAAADKFVKSNEFGKIIERNGGEDMNANTSYDETNYHFSLPANRLELWAYLESERFLHPVMREFYKERNVVIEERRLRTDSNPIGRMIEQFTAAAFEAHPYHRPTVGWMADLNSFSATDAQKFYDRYYVPSNMVVAVAGDINAVKAMPILEKYFGRLPAHPAPDESTTTEPPQNSERKVVMKERAQPLYLEGYHRPNYRSKDDAVFDAITDLMSEGRTSRLYRALVRDKKIASFSAGFSGLPGSKYPHLFAFYAFPLPGHSTQEVADAIHAEIDRLKKEDISDDELKMIKTRTKANLIRGLADNAGLATQLATYQTRYGDWRELFRTVDRIDHVTKADIRRIANATFVDTNRTVGVIETGGGSGASGGGPPSPGGESSSDQPAVSEAVNAGGAQ
ncbi:MAG TPA: pitrilysin family protein [Candidatus Sulfotelmatobacter sp.]|jgi:predicted Zn-dependent peptidase|nr:pitrilysin family protein [Candidatus Sulfotelmatobacter sp.]